MSEMFCFQCEQTAGGKSCTRLGVCVSPTVLNVLVEKFGLTPIKTAEEDLKAILGEPLKNILK